MVDLKSNNGFILIEVSLCITLTMIIVCLVFGVKQLEVMHRSSLDLYNEEDENRYIQILRNRNECEIECTTKKEIQPLT